MIRALIDGITAWITNSSLRLDEAAPNDHLHILVNKAAKTQQRIGWDHALEGRISKHWITAHATHQSEQHYRPNNEFGGFLVRALLDFSLAICHSHNPAVHGADATAQHRILNNKLHQQIRRAYDNQDDILDEHDCSVLFSMNLTGRLKQTTDANTNWYLLYDSCLNPPDDTLDTSEQLQPSGTAIHNFFRPSPAYFRRPTQPANTTPPPESTPVLDTGWYTHTAHTCRITHPGIYQTHTGRGNLQTILD